MIVKSQQNVTADNIISTDKIKSLYEINRHFLL